jgi:hypothetical protein
MLWETIRFGLFRIVRLFFFGSFVWIFFRTSGFFDFPFFSDHSIFVLGGYKQTRLKMHHGTETCSWNKTDAASDKEVKDDNEHITRLLQQVTEMHASYELLYQRNVALSAELKVANETIERQQGWPGVSVQI